MVNYIQCLIWPTLNSKKDPWGALHANWVHISVHSVDIQKHQSQSFKAIQNLFAVSKIKKSAQSDIEVWEILQDIVTLGSIDSYINVRVTSSAIGKNSKFSNLQKTLKLFKNFDNKLEIDKNLENKLEF